MKKIYYLILKIVSSMAFLILGNYLVNSHLISNSQKSVVMQIGIYIIAAFSLNLIVSCLGEFSLGHAGLMAIGAYTSAILVKTGCNFIISIMMSGILVCLLGILIGYFSGKFKGDYLAIITLGISEIIRVCIINFESLTGGAKGLKSIPKYSNFMVIYVLVILTYIFVKNFLDSKYGRAIIAIREDEIAAKSIYVNIRYYKILIFSISGFFAGISGALLAGFQGILAPNDFGFMKSIEILMMVVFSGMKSLIGVILSVVSLTSLPLILQSFVKNFNDYRMIIYSLLLLLIIIFRENKVKVRIKKWKN